MTLRWIEDIGDGEERTVGSKAAALSAAQRAGLDVPRGFVVTAQTFEEFVRRNGLEDEIERILESTDRDDLSAVRRAANRIHTRITDGMVDDDVREDIQEAYENINMAEEVRNAGGEAIDLVGGQRETEFVAVRSSPTGTRIPGAHANHVNVNGKDSVVDRVKACWASLYAAEALRAESAGDEIHSMAVIVQRMVDPDVSGAVYNGNPLGGEGLVVESLWGLGTALSDGTATPDMFVVDEDGSVRSREIANKGWKVERDPTSGKTLKQRVASGDREAPTLDDSDLSELVDAVRKAERSFTGNIRLDVGISRGKVHALDITDFTPSRDGSTRSGEGIVRGRGGAAGRGTGTVTMVYGDTDVEGIEEGAVVAGVDAGERLIPALFGIAGIVTDAGGLSSNLATMARRLGIPAVVGTGNGTDMLTAGETVTVDGSGGLVLEGEVDEEPAVDGPDRDVAGTGGAGDVLTATSVTVWNGDAPGSHGIIQTDYVSPDRAADLARRHGPEPVWARTDASHDTPANLSPLRDPGRGSGGGVVLSGYGAVLRAPALAEDASLLALDVPALRRDGEEPLRHAIERLAGADCETAVLLDGVDPVLVRAAVEAGVDRVAVPAHQLDAARTAVARAEKRFMLDRLRDL